MAEFPRKSFLTSEECSRCGAKPAVFLHYVLHKTQYLHICSACVLHLHQGSFCPICFTVYDDPYNLSNNHIKCSSCEAIYHLQCIPLVSSLFSVQPPTGASSSSTPQNHRVVCPYCVNPNSKFNNFNRDETNNTVKIDKNNSSQLLAAAIISDRSMKKATKIASVKAQIMCKESAEARKEAKDALKKLHDLTIAQEVEASESEYVSSDNDGGGDEGSHEDDSGNEASEHIDSGDESSDEESLRIN